VTKINSQAIQEGWSIFSTSEAGDWQIQKCDEYNVFSSDYEVWKFVLAQAKKGKKHCVEALEFLKIQNPEEYDYMLDFVVKNA